MIRDAADVTRMTPAAWRMDPVVRKIASMAGVVIPPTDLRDNDAPPVVAFVNWGVWKALCPNPICFGKAEDAWRDWPWFFCMKCGNAQTGGAWRPVAFPDDVKAVEAFLEPLDRPHQNWHPTERTLGADTPDDDPPDDEDEDTLPIAEQNARMLRAKGLPLTPEAPERKRDANRD